MDYEGILFRECFALSKCIKGSIIHVLKLAGRERIVEKGMKENEAEHKDQC